MQNIETGASGVAALRRRPDAPATRKPVRVRRKGGASLTERLLAALGRLVVRLLMAAAVLGLVAAAWVVWTHPPYHSGEGVGYALGLCGGLMMLALLMYPLRKRIRWVRGWGPLKGWFRFHMAAGILGPMMVVFHSTFRVGSVNAGVALASLSLVVASGVVGRFLYRRIHHGLYGSLATLGELERGLELEMVALEPMLDRLPAVEVELGRFARLVSYRPRGFVAQSWHFLTLGPRRALLAARLQRTLLESTAAQTESLLISRAEISQTLKRVDHALRTLQRCAQFRTYERLFSAWHVIHIPFLWMLVITAIVHVVAVHAY